MADPHDRRASSEASHSSFAWLCAGIALASCGVDAPESAADSARDAHGLRLVPTTVAAAEYAREIAASEDFAALPEQVGQWSSRDFQSPPWGGLPRFSRFAAEPLFEHRPSVVVCNAWQASETVAVLREAGVRVVVLPAALRHEDIEANLDLLGRELGRVEAAQAAKQRLRERVLALRARGASGWRAIAYTNDGVGGTASGEGTTIRTIMELAGLVDASGVRGHALVDFESLLARDPDVFVVGAPSTDERGATEALLLSTPALSGMRAVRERRIAVLPVELYSTDSPTIIDAAELLATRIEELGGGR
jgi:iron complex transport system substrate-binding protein